MRHFMEKKKRSKSGCLILVGAGPGDPELMSIKGLRALQAADIILYDNLVNPKVFDLAFGEFNHEDKNQKHWLEKLNLSPDDFDPASALEDWLPSRRPNRVKPRKSQSISVHYDVVSSNGLPELIYVGKKHGQKHNSQERINEIILEKLELGKTVVRLKGGDPFIFARGVEELEVAEQNGFEYQIIPGLTSGLALPVNSGIALTLRAKSDSVSLVTGHEITNQKIDNWVRLLDLGSSLVIYMGLINIVEIRTKLLEAVEESMPIAAISCGSTEDEKVIYSSLGSITQDLINKSIKSPTILVVGKHIKQNFKPSKFNLKSKKPEHSFAI